MEKMLKTDEQHSSQIPALQLLVNVGYQPLTSAQALQERQGKYSNVLLEYILRKQLQQLNCIHYKGSEHPFSEPNIQEAIRKIKNVQYDGLQKTNEAIYNMITFGVALEQTVEGSKKSFNLNYIDWKTPSNNVFHVVPEFTVERSHSYEKARPDIVLFVNGIPFAVIECKASSPEVEQAVSQNIRNQGDGYIPKLFIYAQLVMAVSKNSAKYGTVNTPAEFWSVWKEFEDKEEELAKVINTALSESDKEKLFSDEFIHARAYFDDLEKAGSRQVTEQDKALYSLCRPERLLDLTYHFTLFEHKVRKIARYQQFFVVRSALSRIKTWESDKKRTNGLIFHSQGSGKSLTMVMLVRALALDESIKNPRIVLVTDRTDLDEQLKSTFIACDLSAKRATSGSNLVKLLKDKTDVITTLIHKFNKGLEKSNKFIDESPDIFVLIDESHRTTFGELESKMRQMLPNSCYIGFTGTPLMRKQKNSFTRIGRLIEPRYSINQAVEDKAVVPLRYEARHVKIEQDPNAMDLWFERHTADLSTKQKADLKKKYARAKEIDQTDRVIHTRAFDISEHFRAYWQNTGFKAQLVAPRKAAALKYHKYLQDIGYVSSAVIISPPDMREGHEKVDEGPTDEVVKFWQQMMREYSSEEEYTKRTINKFKQGDQPEILIVVDRLLTGFDAPRNTVLYLCRSLKEHTLLQAVARVNRLHKGKQFGYIVDYAGVLKELDQTLTAYNALGEFDQDDIEGALISIDEEIKELPQQHSNLCDIFKTVSNELDQEAYERHLANEEYRDNFCECLSSYSKTLAIALSSSKFITNVDERKLRTYKEDLKQFEKLRKSVMFRYGETVDYGKYEAKIKKLLNTHIKADEVTPLNEPVDIFDTLNFEKVKEGQGIYSNKTVSARADAIAHATKRKINEKMKEDPAFYEKFSKMIQQVIDNFKAHRISDLDYLNQVSDIRNKVVSKRRDDVPESIRDNDEACAYYGILKQYFESKSLKVKDEVVADIAKAIHQMLEDEQIVDFWYNENAINKVKNRMDDILFELRDTYKIELEYGHMDEIIEDTMRIAQNRRK